MVSPGAIDMAGLIIVPREEDLKNKSRRDRRYLFTGFDAYHLIFMKDPEIILMIINSEDRPGVTSGLTEILARHDAFILDIGQADIHRNLSLGILFMAQNSGEIMKDLLFKAYEWM